jgi:hypothetical protein
MDLHRGLHIGVESDEEKFAWYYSLFLSGLFFFFKLRLPSPEVIAGDPTLDQ